MRGKKQIAAVVLAVIFAVTAGMPHSTVYAEPDSTGNAQAADAAADDTQKEEKKEEDMTPEELEKKAEEDAYIITALIPGIKAEDLNIQIVNETLSIQGELVNDREENARYLLAERPFGKFCRTLTLPEPRPLR